MDHGKISKPTTMHIGFLIPEMLCLGKPANGVKEQALHQAQALQDQGCRVTMLDAWEWKDIDDFDVVQFFAGGYGFYGIEALAAKMTKGIMVFAPIIDSNRSFGLYRLAAELGNIHARVDTIPGMLQTQARGSDLIICRSRHEMLRVTKGLGVSENKVEIVLNGVNNSPSANSDWKGIRSRLHLPEEYVLHVSAYTEERKNVVKLAEAVARLAHPLVIAGFAQAGPVLDRLTELARHHPQIRLLGFLDKEELYALYAGCRVFALPSTHEGTGLVALEAGAFGANVVITKNGGPPDYFEDLVEYVDPDSVDSIEAAVKAAWEKPKTDALRMHLQSRLTWAQSARALRRAYEKHIIRKHPERNPC